MLKKRDNNAKLKEMRQERTNKKRIKKPTNKENSEQPNNKETKQTTMGNKAFGRTETKPHAYEQQTQ